MLAGKYIRGIANSPVGSAVAGGAAAAGLSALGNVGSDKPGDRIALEALGAAGLGALAGSQIPARSKMYSKANAEGGGRVVAEQIANDPSIPNEQKVRGIKNVQRVVKATPPLAGALSAGTVALGGAVGGQIGGGVANLMGIDPENYGSNNTMGARYSMQGYV